MCTVTVSDDKQVRCDARNWLCLENFVGGKTNYALCAIRLIMPMPIEARQLYQNHTSE